MSETRAEIDRSIEATKAALAKLSPAQLDLVLDQTKRTLEDFIRTEWLPVQPHERAAVERRRAAAEYFHSQVRVHDFTGWRAA